jgi:hypothetical protein
MTLDATPRAQGSGPFFTACDVGQDATAPSERLDGFARERRDLSDDELEQHIDDLAWSWRTAYARFQEHGLAADRDEALMLLHLHNRAVLARSPAAQAARWAEIERAIDDGVGYFDACGAAARARREASAA